MEEEGKEAAGLCPSLPPLSGLSMGELFKLVPLTPIGAAILRVIVGAADALTVEERRLD